MSKIRDNLFPYIKFLIGWPLSLIAFIFIIKLVLGKTSEIKPYLNDIDYLPLILGFALFMSYFLLRSFLWLKILNTQGATMSFMENTYKFSFSELKRYVPGNLWSFLSRASMFEDAGIERRAVGISLIADIQLVVIGCGLASIFSVPWILNSGEDLSLKLASIVPISLIAIALYFLGTGYLYKRKFDAKGSLLKNIILPGINLQSKVILSLISSVCYFMFGLANYFVFQSVIFPNESILILASFFVFSLLVGYLSFITPMGLGIREGIVTLGLSKIITLTQAGFVSIFTRIVLMISEVTFLLLLILWKNFLKR